MIEVMKYELCRIIQDAKIRNKFYNEEVFDKFLYQIKDYFLISVFVLQVLKDQVTLYFL